jgi:hypothetical protein
MSCICPHFTNALLYMHIYNVHEKGKVNDNRFVKNWFKDEVSR